MAIALADLGRPLARSMTSGRAVVMPLALLLVVSGSLLSDVPEAQADDGDGSGGFFREDEERNEDGGGTAVIFGARSVDISHIRAGARRSSGGAPPCTYEVDLHFDRDNHLVNQDAVPHNAIFYWAHCDEMSYLRWYVPGAGADPVAAGQLTELIQEAFDRIEAAGPTLTLSPGLEHYQLTGMPTFLAIDPAAWDDPPTGSVTAGSITVTAWLEPVEVTWDLGTGDVQACQGPGNTYADGVPLREQTIDCPYVFTTHPADHFGSADATGYDIAATVTYLANYRVEGFPPGGPAIEATLGPIDGPTATGHQEVREMRAVLTTGQG